MLHFWSYVYKVWVMLLIRPLNSFDILTGNWYYYQAVVEDLFHNAFGPDRVGSRVKYADPVPYLTWCPPACHQNSRRAVQSYLQSQFTVIFVIRNVGKCFKTDLSCTAPCPTDRQLSVLALQVPQLVEFPHSDSKREGATRVDEWTVCQPCRVTYPVELLIQCVYSWRRIVASRVNVSWSDSPVDSCTATEKFACSWLLNVKTSPTRGIASAFWPTNSVRPSAS